jgi:hypothetical protein
MKTKELLKEDVFESNNDPFCGLGGSVLAKRIKMKKLRAFILTQKAKRTLDRES